MCYDEVTKVWDTLVNMSRGEWKMIDDQNLSHEWFIHVNDEDKRLYVSREKPNPSGAFSPCDMSPEDVDYEMNKGKN